MKIIGIGLSRTGTTSLGKALNLLGIKSKDFPSVRYFPHFLLWIKKKELRNYDAFTDISVIPFYKKLDRQFPGSKFIYTVRDEEAWLSSCQKYPRFNFPKKKLPWKIIKIRQVVYGTTHFDKEKFLAAKAKHHQDVMNYFKGREKDLLIIDITKEDVWEKLCPFIGKDIPNKPFPHFNKKRKVTSV